MAEKHLVIVVSQDIVAAKARVLEIRAQPFHNARAIDARVWNVQPEPGATAYEFIPSGHVDGAETRIAMVKAGMLDASDAAPSARRHRARRPDADTAQ